MHNFLDIDKDLLQEIDDLHSLEEGTYNIRKNGESISRKSDKDIEIISKTDKDGLDIIVNKNVINKVCHIPVILTKLNVKENVYNDFWIGDNSDVTIVAGCGIDCSGTGESEHNGIHIFHLGKNSRVKYIEKHIATGDNVAKKNISPITKIFMDNNSYFEIETTQLGGVDFSNKKTYASLKENAKLIVKEKLLTTNSQEVQTKFYINLNGKNSSVDVISRSVAKNNSKQYFFSSIKGNNECFGHVECDGIILDNAKVISTPKIIANNIDASLVHEAAIGKIAGEQIVKLMSLGLTQEEAQDVIIKGFLK